MVKGRPARRQAIQAQRPSGPSVAIWTKSGSAASIRRATAPGPRHRKAHRGIGGDRRGAERAGAKDLDGDAKRRRLIEHRLDRADDAIDLRQPGVGDDENAPHSASRAARAARYWRIAAQGPRVNGGAVA